jgi:hypothetical protein
MSLVILLLSSTGRKLVMCLSYLILPIYVIYAVVCSPFDVHAYSKNYHLTKIENWHVVDLKNPSIWYIFAGHVA